MNIHSILYCKQLAVRISGFKFHTNTCKGQSYNLSTPMAEQSVDESKPELKRKAEDELRPKLDLKKIRRQKASRPGFGDDRFNETEYYFQNGLRKVYPYNFTFTTFCKGRWVGHLILDVFAREFRAHPREVYDKALQTGLVTVNNEIVSPDYRLKENDLLANSIHRHEVPVLAAPLKIIHQSSDILVVDKPPSVPVHPCGRYRHNSVIYILAKEHNLKELYTVHRLDRLTSGILLFCLSQDRARKLEEEIKERRVQKEYVCRVEGNFPDEPVTCSESIEVLSHKIGVCIVGKYGKECTTMFEKMSFNGKSSVVKCRPKTGRMHQIRVHLQYLGYPIVNDPLYNHEVFGPEKGKGGIIGNSKEKLVEDLLKLHTLENWLTPEENCGGLGGFNNLKESTNLISEEESQEDEEPETDKFPKSLGHYIEDSDFKVLVEKRKFDPSKYIKEPNCYECGCRYKDPSPSDLIMYLHALSYKGEGWQFETSWPVWAREDWIED